MMALKKKKKTAKSNNASLRGVRIPGSAMCFLSTTLLNLLFLLLFKPDRF